MVLYCVFTCLVYSWIKPFVLNLIINNSKENLKEDKMLKKTDFEELKNFIQKTNF